MRLPAVVSLRASPTLFKDESVMPIVLHGGSSDVVSADESDTERSEDCDDTLDDVNCIRSKRRKVDARDKGNATSPESEDMQPR